MEVATFICSICGESSTQICIFCTKDTCNNHLCERCLRCSDCCVCGMTTGTSNRNDHTEVRETKTIH